jgi:hypothetical protein
MQFPHFLHRDRTWVKKEKVSKIKAEEKEFERVSMDVPLQTKRLRYTE